MLGKSFAEEYDVLVQVHMYFGVDPDLYGNEMKQKRGVVMRFACFRVPETRSNAKKVREASREPVCVKKRWP